MKILFAFLSIVCSCFAQAQTSPVEAMRAVQSAKPGDTILVADGIYKDIELNFIGRADSLRPVVIKAQTPGRVILSGQSSLRIAGTGIEVNGFYFTKGYVPKGAVIEFRSGNEVASHCRVTQCAIDNYSPPSRETENSWVLLYGRNNRFDHNSIVGKQNAGVTLAVILDGKENIENHHSIDHNYFGERPTLGSNGGETIRVGTSQSSLLSSRTKIENNLFEHCDGEVEVVSIKSCDNIIRHNFFYQSAGVLALRHGHRNLVEGNTFNGNYKPNTGGVRIINEGHIIRNNTFLYLTGKRFYAALAVMNAVPNSLPNRYHQVKDVLIENNIWKDCSNIEFGVGKDQERTLAATNVTLKNNFFLNTKTTEIFKAYDKLDGLQFIGNKIRTKSGKLTRKGFTEIADKDQPFVRDVPDGGVGAPWFQPPAKKPVRLSGKRLTVLPAQNSLAQAISSAAFGDVIELSAEGEYYTDAPIEIKTYLRIQAAPGLKTKPVIRYNGTKGKVSMITIADDGMLEVDGLAFDGDAMDGNASATSAIAPAAIMRTHYGATVNNCAFYNFTESSFAPFKVAKGSFADTLRFTNCLFRDMSGDAISLAAEKQDDGKYNAEYVEVTNCAFYKVLGYALDLYRGGSDESTTGPAVVVDHCVLEDVNNKERGAGLRLFGVQSVVVRNTSFANTGRGGASIKFDETTWDKIAVTHCNVFNSGRIASFWGSVVSGPVFNLKPAYQSIASYNFLPAAASPLSTKATDGGAIGLVNSAGAPSKNKKSINQIK